MLYHFETCNLGRVEFMVKFGLQRATNFLFSLMISQHCLYLWLSQYTCNRMLYGSLGRVLKMALFYTLWQINYITIWNCLIFKIILLTKSNNFDLCFIKKLMCLSSYVGHIKLNEIIGSKGNLLKGFVKAVSKNLFGNYQNREL